MTRTINATFSILLIGTATANLRGSRELSSYSNIWLKDNLRMRGTCILFTAPHATKLIGNRAHKPELNTDNIAIAFSQAINGGFVTWKENTPVSHKNWDPNYLPDVERTKHGWMKAMHTARSNCRSSRGLHIDVHGMGDSTAIRLGQHMVLGTKAMETTVNGGKGKTTKGLATTRISRQHDEKKSLALRKNLQNRLKSVFVQLQRNPSLTLQKHGSRLPIISDRVKGREPMGCAGIKNVGVKKYLTDCTKYFQESPNKKGEPKFTGDWGAGKKWGEGINSMTRVSTEKRLWATYSGGQTKPFGCAVQMEMSTELRRLLAKEAKQSDGGLAGKMAKAIKAAYDDTGCSWRSADSATQDLF